MNRLTAKQVDELQRIAKASFPSRRKIRMGQKLMIALHGINPKLYGEVRATPHNPTHDDSRIPVFLTYITE